jgi:tRNA A37 threonylcarbamoyladenosine modification protein TsaB
MINVDSSVKKKRKYATEEERLAAKLRNNKNYYSQFTKKNVEKAKKTLTGKDLEKFLKRYGNHKQQRHARYERKQSMKEEQSTVPIIRMPKKRREEEIRKANRAASMQIGSKVWSSKKQ